jgi:hypothetical protein
VEDFSPALYHPRMNEVVANAVTAHAPGSASIWVPASAGPGSTDPTFDSPLVVAMILISLVARDSLETIQAGATVQRPRDIAPQRKRSPDRYVHPTGAVMRRSLHPHPSSNPNRLGIEAISHLQRFGRHLHLRSEPHRSGHIIPAGTRHNRDAVHRAAEVDLVDVSGRGSARTGIRDRGLAEDPVSFLRLER